MLNLSETAKVLEPFHVPPGVQEGWFFFLVHYEDNGGTFGYLGSACLA